MKMAGRRTNPVLKSLEELDVATLSEVIERATQLRKTRMDEARAALKAETAARAKELGLSVEELFGREPTRRRAAAGRRGRKPARTQAVADVKFRSPQGETWSGRGRPPRWIVDAEAKGQKRDKFRV
jgi:DNA-binding protein H-NS